MDKSNIPTMPLREIMLNAHETEVKSIYGIPKSERLHYNNDSTQICVSGVPIFDFLGKRLFDSGFVSEVIQLRNERSNRVKDAHSKPDDYSSEQLFHLQFDYELLAIDHLVNTELAVDIDETLAQTNLLWAQHHLKAYGNPEGLSAEEIIKKYRFVKDVPYWQFDDAYKWVGGHIDSNEAKLEIPVIDEAIEVMQNIPVVCYLTNRPRNTMDGSKKWLEKHGFPDREIVSSINSLEWKAQKLAEMFPEVTGIIDDNVDLLQYISQEYKGRIFLYSHSESTASKLEVILCPTWADIEKEVQQFR